MPCLPDFKIEEEILTLGKMAIGLDEAGRGPLAGPVVAGAVWVNPEIFKKDFPQKKLIRDSKTLSEKQRQIVADFILNNENFIIGIGLVSHQVIDEINILGASLLAMRKALDDLFLKVENLEEKNFFKDSKEKLSQTVLLVDGKFKIPKVKFEQRTFCAGDSKIFSIAAASICAKVFRDKIMADYHKKFPEYGFDKHKGYGTKAHLEALAKFGHCEIHRKTFAPVREILS